jgi:hypothetical protein
MGKSINCRQANISDVPAICELGQLLNTIHHAVRPDIYTAATQDFSRDAPHWMSFFEEPGQMVFIGHVDGVAVWTFNAPAVRLYEEMGFETRAFEMGMPL